MLRAPLQELVETLLKASHEGGEITLDALGEAVGALTISYDEIDAVMRELERHGRTLVGPEGGQLEAHLMRVIPAARALATELKRKPTLPEIAERASLTPDQVRHALALARVMQR